MLSHDEKGTESVAEKTGQHTATLTVLGTDHLLCILNKTTKVYSIHLTGTFSGHYKLHANIHDLLITYKKIKCNFCDKGE
jgi:hypothetical protein